jgi:hypothetical protein
VQAVATTAAPDAQGYPGDGTTDLYLGFAVEGGVRVASSHVWWFHGELAYIGRTKYWDGSTGEIGQIRFGVEVRTCMTRNSTCGVAMLDLGIERGRNFGDPYVMSTTGTALVAIPRLAVDFGGKRVRGRLGVELTEALYARGTQYGTEALAWWGLAVVGGAGYQW